MRKVKDVEKRIWDIEAFNVMIRRTDGRDMRSVKNDLPQYNKFECIAKNEVTVADSKARRFASIYPGLAIDVLDWRWQRGWRR
jgi:hypothetical protein